MLPVGCGTGLEGVTVGFGDGPAVLRDVTLLAGPGEVLAVVGPSGCGKTTALRAVAGLQAVRAGTVRVGGRDVTRIPTPHRNVAMVFQETALIPFLDVATNMATASATKVSPDVASRVVERGRRLGIGRLMSRMPRTLSPGESGLAGVGRALVRKPEVFLFDEPLAHLDAGHRIRTRRTIVEFVKRTGVAAIYVTHDQAEAMAVADRLAVLREGAVVQVGAPRAVYSRPVDTFVAGFVGSPEIGMLPATVVITETGAGFRVGGRTVPLWDVVPEGVGDGQPVLLGLRPEDVSEAVSGADPAAVAIPAVVQSVERIGRTAVIRAAVAVPGEGDGAVLTARMDAASSVERGQRVELAVDGRRAHVFDPVSGVAIAHPSA
ncbi:ABC transporter ATP-binding protein [Pseudonocardia sp. TRM90224]|uniref:ABC transporter ATP-binding protein n=1 Tax=Pseudonocardia sp. TRM90224 TaxID=2812678 RepID=UPI001E466A57|nr:ABC transporter ATP-binding protein [Pseudonocardia sp. TRM90224]